MTKSSTLSRRSLFAMAGAAALGKAAPGGKHIPVGLELYSVRDALKEDLTGTVRAVAGMGYEGVEFYAPYYEWTADKAKQVRTLLDDLGIRCFSTHNSARYFTADSLPHAIELNQILGAKFLVMASAGQVEGLDGWKQVADRLNETAARLKPEGLRTGFHNHHVEFTPIDGVRPIEVLAKQTGKDVALQLDVGTCLAAGSDPVAWIEQNPGRIASMHLKDWAPGEERGYRVLFGEGKADWKQVLSAAEKTGGVEYFLIEQEGSAYSPIETVERCLSAYRKLRG